VDDDPTLLAEHQHLATAQRCLSQMLDSAERIADFGVDELASEALGRLRSNRIRALSAERDAPAFFGRTDRDAESSDLPAPLAGNHGPQTHPPVEVLHIGRRHIRDGNGDPVVIDWRAPIARAFYRATARDRQGVRLRRRFGFNHGLLTSFEDEHLDAGQALGLASALLRAEIERPRVGPMRDIVATIQPDQDELVRADLETSVCVQGAPGTGKTAVGLHRAAYLLYTYPERLRRSGVLVVGPNSAFLRYIEQVLPALGEAGITQTTVDDLVAHAPIRSFETPETAALKGDARMAGLLSRALVSNVAKPEDGLLILVGLHRYRVPRERCRRYVDDCRRALLSGELRWNTGRERLRQLLAQDAGSAPSDAETARIARSAAVTAFLDQVWPAVDPATILGRLWSDAEFARRCARNELSEQELASLAWATPPRSARAARFSAADLVLIDELRAQVLGVDGFAHVVLDEAQDLSAMQCRAIARRCPLGSLTVLGDLAQATTVWAVGSWAETMRHLGHEQATVQPLTAGYRVPGQVLEVANRLLPHIAPDVAPARSIRGDADSLTFGGSLVSATRRCLEHEGSVAVIAADAAAGAIRGTLTEAGIGCRDLADEAAAESAAGSAERVTVVPATAAKGLEYDSVVLVEPAAIVAGESTRLAGLRRLYVTWTRAVSRLAVVHETELPPELGVSVAAVASARS